MHLFEQVEFKFLAGVADEDFDIEIYSVYYVSVDGNLLQAVR